MFMTNSKVNKTCIHNINISNKTSMIVKISIFTNVCRPIYKTQLVNCT